MIHSQVCSNSVYAQLVKVVGGWVETNSPGLVLKTRDDTVSPHALFSSQ